MLRPIKKVKQSGIGFRGSTTVRPHIQPQPLLTLHFSTTHNYYSCSNQHFETNGEMY